MNCNQNLIAWPEGNSVLLRVQAKQPQRDNEGQVVTDQSGNVVYVPLALDAMDAWDAAIVRRPAGTRYDVESALDATDGSVAVLSLPSSLPTGEYNVELTISKAGMDGRSYEVPVFAIVDRNSKANMTFQEVSGVRTTDIALNFTVVPQATTQGKSAYEEWLELPGNTGKTLQDFIDEVLNLNANAAAALVATEGAERVNATLNGVVLTVTDRNGNELSVNTKGDKGDPGTTDYNELENKPNLDVYQPKEQGKGLSTNDYTNEDKQKVNSALQSETDPTVPQWAKQPNKPSYTAQEVGALPNSTKYGSTIDFAMDSATYVLTLSLKDQDGTVLNTKTVDLPIESVVVNGRYDATNKKIVLTLQSGSTIDVPVGDLIAGLQTEITSVNMLNADLVDDANSTHKFVTAQEKADWNNKSNFSGSYNDLTDKPTIPVVPTNVSAFNNDAGYLTQHQDISGKADKSEMSVTDGTGADSDKTTIQLKSGTSATVLKSHQSLAGKQDVIDAQHKLSADLVDDSTTTNKFTNATEKQAWNNKQDALVSGTNIKTINNESILGSGNIDIQGGGGSQVQSDWEQSDNTAVDYIKNKPTIPEIPSNTAYLSSDSGEGIVPDDGIRAVTVTSAAAMTVNPDVVTVINGDVGTAAITLQVPQDNLAHVWDIMMTTDSSVAITFAMSNSATILAPSGFSVGASKAVEVSVIGVGTKYYLRYGEFA